jgi:hypothetical protein
VVDGLGRRSKAIGDVAAEDEKNDVALVGVDTVDDVADGTEEPTLSSRKRIGAIPRRIRKSSLDGDAK